MKVRSEEVYRDIASYVERTEQLDSDYDKLAVALELVQGTGCRPEVAGYIRERMAELAR